MILNAGDLFRHYRVVERVGEGGMGVVYRARDTKLDRDVALKFMVHAARVNHEHADRLRREARALAALNHPNILTIHDIGDADGLPFLVLEWVGGGALSDSSCSARCRSPSFSGSCCRLSEALGTAHAHGIVHRDVKPANVLVSEDGRIKLADFGLAKFRDLARDLTQTAGVVGTVAYMSPEQASGGEVGPASDVFSLGVLAYELLTGERPFKGESPGAVIGAILSGRHAPLTVDGAHRFPANWPRLSSGAWRRAPEDRFQSGTDLAAALRRALSGSELAAPLAQSRPFSATRRGRGLRAGHPATAPLRTGCSIAYSVVGSGPFIVRVLGHFTHLEMEWEWPDLRRFWEQLAARFTVVRYDGRGMGLSDPYTGDFTEDTRQLDLEAVLTAVGARDDSPAGNLRGRMDGGDLRDSTSRGRDASHPLRGVYPRGPGATGIRSGRRPGAADADPQGLGARHSQFRQVFTSQFFREDADPGLIAHFNELQRVSASPETAARYYESCHRRGDGRDLFRQVRIPTLVIHSRDDLAVRADEGRLLASIIPGAQLVLLPSGMHYFPTDGEVVSKATGAIARFLHGSDGYSL